MESSRIFNRQGSSLKAKKKDYKALNKERDMFVYREYLMNQFSEILTNYGKVDMLWLDYSFPDGYEGKGRKDWGSIELIKKVRKLQPKIILNDRLDLKEYWRWMGFYNARTV